MNMSSRLALAIGLVYTLAACDGSSGSTSGTSVQGDESDSGYLIISSTHASLSDGEMIFFRSAEARTDRHELTVGGVQLQEEQSSET